MPKVLIITYYWPPAGGSGVQRWLKFTKYLREFGWEPVIYTAQNPEAPGYDNELLKEIPQGIEVIKKSVWEPYTLFRKLSGRKDQKFGAGLASQGKSKRGLINSIALWVRGNFFIPDARMFWIRPSFIYLTKYLKENPVDVIVSTGPPHSTHLIAKKISKKLKIPWVADFRDPWTNIDYFDSMNPSFFARAIHRKLEKTVFEESEMVVTVTPSSAQDFKLLGAKRVEVIENGFDEEDFKTGKINVDSNFTLTHIGTIAPNRNCIPLWNAIANSISKNQEFAQNFRLRFAGSIDATVIDSLKERNLLEYCDFLGYLSHTQTVELLKKSQVLLLIVNKSPNAKGILTGKIFEYFAAKRPILAVGPNGGDVEELITKTNSGLFASYDNPMEIVRQITQMWQWYADSWKGFDSSGIEKYSRREQTRRMANLFDSVVIDTKK